MSRIALLGDIAHAGILSQTPDLINVNFRSLGELLCKFDKVIGNLEFPVKPDHMQVPNEYFHYTSEVSTRLIIKALNLNILSLANNHIQDLGHEGLYKTIELLESEGVLFTGAGYQPEHTQPLLFELSGKRYGLMAYVDLQTNPKIKESEGLYINYLEPVKLVEKIKQIKKQVDTLILSIHWGNDYSFYPTKDQLANARKFVASGADIIMGHHPHTIQPFERINNSYIFYSLGQVCFGDFFWEGELRSIRKKTKKSFSPVFNEDLKLVDLINIKEEKGNKIQIINRNIQQWSKKKLFYTKLKHKWALVNFIINIKEGIMDRVWEFLFGYYRNPLVQLFNIKTYKKGNRISSYFKYLKNRN